MFTDAGHTVDSLEVVKQRVEAKEAILVDVREQEEWDAGHLKAATFLPLSKVKDGSAAADLEKLPKDKPIYLHCKAGGRVLMCAEMLNGKGWDIRPLRTGFDGLVKAGFSKAE